MTAINDITSTHLSRVLVHNGTGNVSAAAGQADFAALFATSADYTEIPHVAGIPPLGAQPNLMNINEFGVQVTSQIPGQQAAPPIEFQLNYVPTDWATGTTLNTLLTSRTLTAFAVVILGQEATNLDMVDPGNGGPWLGLVPNAVMFFKGRMESLTFDAPANGPLSARLTVSFTGGKFYGMYTF